MDKKIIMLTAGGESSTFMYNALQEEFPIAKVILEKKISRKKFLKRRIKKMGYVKVIGQVLFQISIPKLLKRSSQKRIEEIKTAYQLDSQPIPNSAIYKVNSVNSKECIAFLKKEKPDLIIVNGTRIISKKVLNCTAAIFINTHVGITPKYRGVHGGYWALANQDQENCGVTVHLVDSGIDTGGILFQQNIETTPKDNFLTYTYLQTGEGIKMMKKAIVDFTHHQLTERLPKTKESQLWYHPTIWFYLYTRLTKGVK